MITKSKRRPKKVDQYPIVTLPNGIRVVAAPQKERQSVSLGIWVGVGGRDEQVRTAGISHFLEHIVFKGTHTRTANQIKESVEGVGGSLNAFTSEEYTCFLAKASYKHFESVFDVLSDMVLNASIKEEDVKKERTVIMEEIKMTQDQPSHLVDENLTEILWPEHPLGRPLAGTLDTVGALTRENLVAYRDRYYEPGLITVVAAGNVTQKALLKATELRFKGAGRGTVKDLELFSGLQNKSRVKIFKKDTEQVHLALGLHTFPKEHPDQYALDVLSVVLGGNMSSRLFNEVREERGLAYDIGAFVRRFQETGAFVVSAGVDNHKYDEALKVIIGELDKVTRQPVGADELKRSKEFYLGQLELGLENSMSQMLWVGENVVSLGRCKTSEEVVEHVEKVSAEDVRRVAKGLFKSKGLNLALVGAIDPEREKGLGDLLSFSGI